MWDSIKFWMAKSLADLLVAAAIIGLSGLIFGVALLRAWWKERRTIRPPNKS